MSTHACHNMSIHDLRASPCIASFWTFWGLVYRSAACRRDLLKPLAHLNDDAAGTNENDPSNNGSS